MKAPAGDPPTDPPWVDRRSRADEKAIEAEAAPQTSTAKGCVHHRAVTPPHDATGLKPNNSHGWAPTERSEPEGSALKFMKTFSNASVASIRGSELPGIRAPELSIGCISSAEQEEAAAVVRRLKDGKAPAGICPILYKPSCLKREERHMCRVA